jgi:hypothetical protein
VKTVAQGLTLLGNNEWVSYKLFAVGLETGRSSGKFRTKIVRNLAPIVLI